MKHKKMSWKEFDKAIDVLAEQIKKEHILPKAIYGVPRGGLIIAICLSHKLGIPLVSNPIDDTLFVDDVAETGDTLERLYFKNKHFIGIAVLYWSINCRYCVHHYSKRKANDVWIDFPWERK